MSGVHLEMQVIVQMWLVVAVFTPITAEFNWNSLPPPSFEEDSVREFFATPGQTVLLPCHVRFLRDKVVSWIRSRDLHILTSGPHTFSSDSRFSVIHPATSGDFWGLRITGVLTSDAGRYECQINTDPKLSLPIKLSILTLNLTGLQDNPSKWVSQALIKGPPLLIVNEGYKTTLTCEVSALTAKSLTSDAHGLFFRAKPRVRWLHEGREVLNENGVRIETIYRDNDLKMVSRIYLGEVRVKDGGLWTCMQPSTKPDTIRLTVVEGEHSEAMMGDFPGNLNEHHANGVKRTRHNRIMHFLYLLICILFVKL